MLLKVLIIILLSLILGSQLLIIYLMTHLSNTQSLEKTISKPFNLKPWGKSKKIKPIVNDDKSAWEKENN